MKLKYPITRTEKRSLNHNLMGFLKQCYQLRFLSKENIVHRTIVCSIEIVFSQFTIVKLDSNEVFFNNEPIS